MRKNLLPFAFACIAGSFAFMPAINAGRENAQTSISAITAPVSTNTFTEEKEATEKSAALALYERLDLASLGLSSKAMEAAYKGYQHLMNQGSVNNPDILTIVDFSQSSFKKRMYIIDLKKEKVLVNTYVAHGKNSGLQHAERFSNIPESLQSSLGFYVTKGTYHGKHGLSLRLDGKEFGINHKAEERAIVVHGADYIGEHRKKAPYMGRSFGCPAVPRELSDKVINTIKNGSCFFIYHPSSTYLHKSKILNG